MALGTRHILRQSSDGFRQLYPEATRGEIGALLQERFLTEGFEEFEGRLIAAQRVSELEYHVAPNNFIEVCKQNRSGLLLLTPHFDSFLFGTVLLGISGLVVNVMTSAVTHHPQVADAVQRHFYSKYRGIERYLNGGRMLNMEEGLRPFYRMLEQGECLVILADSPAVAGGAEITPLFLGGRRKIAGGLLRLARKTGSRIGGFICRHTHYGRYLLKGGAVFDQADADTLDAVYQFLSAEILAAPGRWVAADMLPLMPLAAKGIDS